MAERHHFEDRSETGIARDPRATFRAAYRLARIAFRGMARHALKVDLQSEPDFSSSCRRCNAGCAVTRKVAAVVGHSNHALCIYSQAVRIALGEAPPRQPGMPGRLDFDGWIEWRAWSAEQREAA